MNKPKFTVEEIKNYIESQDSMGDILYNLNELNIIKSQPLTDVELADVDMEDYPKFCDAKIVAAKRYGIEVSQEELDELNYDSELVNNLVFELIINK